MSGGWRSCCMTIRRSAPIELKGFFGTGVVISRTAHGQPAPVAMPSWPAPPPAGAPPPPIAAATEAPPPATAAASLKEIKSPMVGTFYAQPEPGAEPYVRVGTRVATGPDGLHHRGDEDHE